MDKMVKTVLLLFILCCSACSRVSYFVFQNDTLSTIQMLCNATVHEVPAEQSIELRALECIFISGSGKWTYDWRDVPREFIETRSSGARIYWVIGQDRRLWLKQPHKGSSPTLPEKQPDQFPLDPRDLH